jgi:hypothetical protein
VTTIVGFDNKRIEERQCFGDFLYEQGRCGVALSSLVAKEVLNRNSSWTSGEKLGCTIAALFSFVAGVEAQVVGTGFHYMSRALFGQQEKSNARALEAVVVLEEKNVETMKISVEDLEKINKYLEALQEESDRVEKNVEERRRDLEAIQKWYENNFQDGEMLLQTLAKLDERAFQGKQQGITQAVLTALIKEVADHRNLAEQLARKSVELKDLTTELETYRVANRTLKSTLGGQIVLLTHMCAGTRQVMEKVLDDHEQVLSEERVEDLVINRAMVEV